MWGVGVDTFDTSLSILRLAPPLCYVPGTFVLLCKTIGGLRPNLFLTRTLPVPTLMTCTTIKMFTFDSYCKYL